MKGFRKMSREDRISTVINYTLLTLFLLVVIYPLYYMLIASISDPNATNQGLVIWRPVRVTFEGYQRIPKYKGE